MHDMNPSRRLRRAIVSGLVLASVCGAVLPAASLASAKVVNTYDVTVDKGILDQGRIVKAPRRSRTARYSSRAGGARRPSRRSCAPV